MQLFLRGDLEATGFRNGNEISQMPEFHNSRPPLYALQA